MQIPHHSASSSAFIQPLWISGKAVYLQLFMAMPKEQKEGIADPVLDRLLERVQILRRWIPNS
jgi:hypothetical protein